MDSYETVGSMKPGSMKPVGRLVSFMSQLNAYSHTVTGILMEVLKGRQYQQHTDTFFLVTI